MILSFIELDHCL